ncbi:hypothetical protein BPOR_0871g00060 [Botrytis porri]|uniref:Uncharacterized protein n=1 Tax=Botrytis porri TaxID=87229 RepID=A0A4Z1KDK1_9HELO|nr:hypothetical protein BPOR_0871g00060 [Botrytis porri]
MAMVNNPATSDGNFPAPGKEVSLDTQVYHINIYVQVVQCGVGKTQNMSSVFKCIYSQCDTAHFGSALHHTITRCVGVADNIILALPRLSNHDSLRRREAEYLQGVKIDNSESIAGYPTLSGLPIQSGLPFSSAVAFSSLPPMVHLTRDTAAASVTPSATAPLDLIHTTYNTAPELATASPLLYTGDAFRILPSILFPFLAPILGLYLAV